MATESLPKQISPPAPPRDFRVRVRVRVRKRGVV